ncbi:hypothetical protein BGZ46_005257 [Entomortierella lignicola]|nr:hypothetical protein BGZ46_005257 [Entomortierella lignicola]
MDSSNTHHTPGTNGECLPIYSSVTTHLEKETKEEVVLQLTTALETVSVKVSTTTATATAASAAVTVSTSLPFNRTTSSAYRVFQIPELAHSIAQYLRPIYISQLRLVSKSLYAAYIPYLRIHLHRNSTASWTVFPLLKEGGDCNIKKSVSNSLIETTSKAKTPTIKGSATVTETGNEIKAKANCTNASENHNVSEKVNHKDSPSGKPAYGELVHDITADSMDNFETLLPIIQDCTNLHTLTITRWSRDLQIFRKVLSMAPKLESLSVSFYNSVDLNVFLATLIIYGNDDINDDSTREESSTVSNWNSGKKKETSKDKENGLRSLRSLDIKHRVPDVNYIRWRVFKSALDKLTNLQHLSLTGIGFRGGKDIADPAITTTAITTTTNLAPLAPFTVSTNNNVTATSANIPHDHDNLGDDDDDDDDDEPRSLEDGNPALSRVYPRLQSLSLTFCECPVPTMLDLDRIFPNLTSLEMNKCRNTWLHVFEPDPHNPTSHLGISSPTSSVSSLQSEIHTVSTTVKGSVTRRVPFPLLTRLKLVDRYEGHEDLIYEIVRNRPGLLSLETHQISLNIDTLLPMASHCVNEKRLFTRFSLSPCWSNSSTRRDVERLFESPFLARVKHLYIQQELTEKIIFSSTLTSLHIGAGFARDSVIEHDSVPTWNAILRRLPMLETLKIDRYIKDYLLFEGLGRSLPIENSAPKLQYDDSEDLKDTDASGIKEGSLETESILSQSLPSKTSNSLIESPIMVQDWSMERPYLQELQITFRATCTVQTTDLDRELVQRFRFLERLYFSCSKRPTDLDDHKSAWRPGLVIEHRRYESK